MVRRGLAGYGEAQLGCGVARPGAGRHSYGASWLGRVRGGTVRVRRG
jgi:hypothetical protein